MKTILGFNLAAGLVLLLGVVLLWVSIFRTTSRYAEFERAGCVNEAQLVKYSNGRFRPDRRQDTARWLMEPTLNIAIANGILALIISATNVLAIVVVLRNANRNPCKEK